MTFSLKPNQIKSRTPIHQNAAAIGKIPRHFHASQVVLYPAKDKHSECPETTRDVF